MFFAKCETLGTRETGWDRRVLPAVTNNVFSFGRGTCLWLSLPEESVPMARFKEPPRSVSSLLVEVKTGRPDRHPFLVFTNHCSVFSQLGACAPKPLALPVAAGLWRNSEIKTLSGGSLGSRVDEERSQLRELM